MTEPGDYHTARRALSDLRAALATMKLPSPYTDNLTVLDIHERALEAIDGTVTTHEELARRTLDARVLPFTINRDGTSQRFLPYD